MTSSTVPGGGGWVSHVRSRLVSRGAGSLVDSDANRMRRRNPGPIAHPTAAPADIGSRAGKAASLPYRVTACRRL